MRFEVLWRDAEIAYLRALSQGHDEASAAAERDRQQAQLQEDFAFIAACNIGGEFLSDEAVNRLRQLGQKTWLRHFDDRLGLSAQESEQLLRAVGPPPPLPVVEPLLADKPEHRIAWGAITPAVERGDPRNTWGVCRTLQPITMKEWMAPVTRAGCPAEPWTPQSESWQWLTSLKR